MSNYILENDSEFDRLEKQSQNRFYDFESELRDFLPKQGGMILDAGCGSGVVSRYLARKFPESKVVGCDFSEIRLKQASTLANGFGNLQFMTANLTVTPFDSSTVDGVVCRFVLEHLSYEESESVVQEFKRILRPGSQVCLIDIDGYLFNVFPETAFMKECFLKIRSVKAPDFHIGRKIPELLISAGFENVVWRIETMQFTGEDLQAEINLIQDRFNQAMPFLKTILGGESEAQRFINEYIEVLSHPECVLFYNKFIVSAQKQKLKSIE